MGPIGSFVGKVAALAIPSKVLGVQLRLHSSRSRSRIMQLCVSSDKPRASGRLVELGDSGIEKGGRGKANVDEADNCTGWAASL